MKRFIHTLKPYLTGRRLLMMVLVAVGAAGIVGVGPRLVAMLYAGNRVYSVDDVPARRVAIVFGAKVFPSGRPSPMLADRVETGADLYHAGKVDVLLMTGDNSVVHYNEPAAMRRLALSLGVPDDAIVLDYAGFRTYDSCYRAREIFAVDSAILVTQAFHLDRALLTCNGLGIDAVGVAADVQRPAGYALKSLIFSHVREFPATTVALADLLLKPRPVLGEPLPIFPDDP